MNDETEIKLKLLELSYQRFLSRAHTIFAVCAGMIPTIIIGITGLFLTLLQIKIVLYNKYYITLYLVRTLIIIVLVTSFMCWVIFDSRWKRQNILNQIRKVGKIKPKKK